MTPEPLGMVPRQWQINFLKMKKALNELSEQLITEILCTETMLAIT
jgi:hypothetical protein